MRLSSDRGVCTIDRIGSSLGFFGSFWFRRWDERPMFGPAPPSETQRVSISFSSPVSFLCESAGGISSSGRRTDSRDQFTCVGIPGIISRASSSMSNRSPLRDVRGPGRDNRNTCPTRSVGCRGRTERTRRGSADRHRARQRSHKKNRRTHRQVTQARRGNGRAGTPILAARSESCSARQLVRRNPIHRVFHCS